MVASAKMFDVSFSFRRPTNLGVKEGLLAPCRSTPNCVSSQADRSDREHFIAPLKASMEDVRRAVEALPRMLQAAFAEMVNGACLSFGMLPVTCRAAAKLLLEHAPPAIANRYVPRLASGEWGATISIS